MNFPSNKWILAVVLVLSAGAMAWGWKGTVTTTIASGQAVLVRAGDVAGVNAVGSGRVTEFTVRPGDTVRQGQIVARISSPLLAAQLRMAEDALAAEPGMAEIDGERERLEGEIDGLAEQSRLAVEQVTQQEKLFAKHGIVAEQARAASLQREMARRRARIVQLQARLERVRELERSLQALREEWRRTTTAVSPCRGEVLELKASPGAPVQVGSPLLTIQPKERAIEAIAHIPSRQAKQVKPGMEATLSPGSLRATVLAVSNAEVRLSLGADQAVKLSLSERYEVLIIAKRPASLILPWSRY